MLTYNEKRLLENELEKRIVSSSGGVDTRVLITNVCRSLRQTVPSLNPHHAAGMIAWVIEKYGHSFIVRTPGGPSVVQ